MSADVVWEFMPDPERDNAFRVWQVESAEWVRHPVPPVEHLIPFELPRGLRRGSSRRGGPARLSRGEAVEVGAQLFGSLPSPLRQHGGSWIQVATAAERLIDVPWECLLAPGSPLAAPETRLTRGVRIPFPMPARTVVLPLRVLLIVTNPKDERLLDPSVEQAAVIPYGVPGVVVRRDVEPTIEALRRALEQVQPHVVHYVGHAAADASQGYLILHDFDGNTRWLSAAELAAMLPASVGLVCLSTCFTAENYDLRGLSRLAHAPPSVPLPTVLFNQLPLERDAQPTVSRFWNEFYGALLMQNGSALEAFDHARRMIASQGSHDDWASWAMVVRDGTGAPFVLDGASPDHAPRNPARELAEFEALLSVRLANTVTLESGSLEPSIQHPFEEATQKALDQAERSLSSVGGLRSWRRR